MTNHLGVPIGHGVTALFPLMDAKQIEIKANGLGSVTPFKVDVNTLNLHELKSQHPEADQITCANIELPAGLPKQAYLCCKSDFDSSLKEGRFGKPLEPSEPITGGKQLTSWESKITSTAIGPSHIYNDMLIMANELKKQSGEFPGELQNSTVTLAVSPNCSSWLQGLGAGIQGTALDLAKDIFHDFRLAIVPELNRPDGQYAMMVCDDAINGNGGYCFYDGSYAGLIITNPKQIVVMKGI